MTLSHKIWAYKVKKFIAEGECIPRGYGIAYHCYERMGTICYPIPINLVVRVWYHFYWWLVRSCRISAFEKMMLNYGQSEWHKGKDYGYQLGLNEGKKEGMKIVADMTKGMFIR